MTSSHASAFIAKQVKLISTPLTEPEVEDAKDKKAVSKVVKELNKDLTTRRAALFHKSRTNAVCEQLAILADEEAKKRRQCEKKGFIALPIDEEGVLDPKWLDQLPTEWGADDYRDALLQAKEQTRRKQMLEEQIEHYEGLLKMLQ